MTGRVDLFPFNSNILTFFNNQTFSLILISFASKDLKRSIYRLKKQAHETKFYDEVKILTEDDFDNNFNHAIMIRSFLSKNQKLFLQAGAGIVSKSNRNNELNEVYNKIGALLKALEKAEEL